MKWAALTKPITRPGEFMRRFLKLHHEFSQIVTAQEVRSLSRLRGRAGVGVSPRLTLPEWREPPPGASRRPPPQAGEVKRACGQVDSTKTSWLVYLQGMTGCRQ